MTEYQLSQWISQSLSGELSEQQRAELQIALEHSPASRAFAEWSSRIQAATLLENQMQQEPVSEADVEPTTPDSSETLSEFSKERMRRAVRATQTEYQAENAQQQQFVAQSPAAYSHSRPGQPSYDSKPLDGSPQSKAPSQPPQDALIPLGRLLRDRLSSQLSSLAALGLPIAEADIDKLLRAEIAALGIKEDVWLMDGRGQILFSSSLAGRDALGQVGQTLAGWEDAFHQLSDSDEVFHPELGAWVTAISYPSPQVILRLVLRR